ncbi:hypothetical protein BKH44_07080 [Helicobacter sp. 13S00477-4]|nr:hypothetical protein BKH44_07080 [Helicobacter sp. 13S00477-4]
MHLKTFLFLAVFSNLLSSLEITLNYGKENSKNFSVLNIKNPQPFACKTIFGHTDIENRTIECIIDAVPKEGFIPVKTTFFEFYYQMIKGKFHLYIKPKKKQKLFAVPLDLKKNIQITREKPSLSKSWQIIGFEDQIPFLSNQKPKGLNFPILIENAQTPYIPELDINNEPLNYSKGFDSNSYMKIKSLMEKKDYYQALNTINETLKQFPDTIFKKDLYLYQLIALSKINKNQQDAIIEIGLSWIKQYPNDTSVPQVLYLLGNAYTGIRYYSESQYYYKRIIQEYPKNRYAPLAKMQLAIQLTNTGNIGSAAVYFQEAYTQAKDIESASIIALNWATFEIKKQNISNAKELIDKILQANPQFFTQEPTRTYKIMDFLKKNKLYKTTADIGEYVSKHTTNTQIQEQIKYDLGVLYQKAKEFDKAHIANLNYLKDYPTNPKAKSVKARDDSILFEISGSNEEKIQRYDYIIKKYPNTEESQKAFQLKAQIFLDEKKYKEVLDMRKDLKENSPIVQLAINKLIKSYLEKNDCKNANIYLLQTSEYQLDDNQKLQAFDCLYDASLNKKAQSIAKGMALNAKNNIDKKLAWLYRDAKNSYQLGDYKTSILAARDALSMSTSTKKSQYYDVGFTLFFDLVNINNKNEALKLSSTLEKLFKNDKRMIKVYATLLEWQKKDKNQTTIQIYAQNIINLQDKYKTDEFTPYTEFELINALIQTHKLMQALFEVDALLDKKITQEQIQKAFYTKGSIQNLQNNTKEAKDSFQKCINIPINSAWKNLCTQALDLLEKQ